MMSPNPHGLSLKWPSCRLTPAPHQNYQLCILELWRLGEEEIGKTWNGASNTWLPACGGSRKGPEGRGKRAKCRGRGREEKDDVVTSSPSQLNRAAWAFWLGPSYIPQTQPPVVIC